MNQAMSWRLLASLALVAVVGASHSVAVAQNVAITDARIIVGNGEVIESGTIVIRDGRIADVGTGRANTRGLTVIDGRGLTAMPGFIDAHRHINTGPNEREEMQARSSCATGGSPR